MNTLFDGGRYVSGREETGETITPDIVKVPGTDAAPAPLGTQNGGANPGLPVAGNPATWTVNDKSFDTRADAKAFAQENASPETAPIWTSTRGMEPLLDQRERGLRQVHLPDLREKRRDANEALQFALSRSGLMGSSVHKKRRADLASDFAVEKGRILSDIATDRATTTSGLEDQRQAILGTLRATGDTSGATEEAITRMTQFANTTPTISPVGDVFAGVTQGIGAGLQGQRDADLLRQIDAVRPSLNLRRQGRNIT